MKKKHNIHEKIKQCKLLSDVVWGYEFSKINWINDEQEWEELARNWSKNIITITGNRIAVSGENVEMIIGMALIVPVKLNHCQIIDNERMCSHPEMWDISDQKNYYLSEIIMYPEYRSSIYFFKILKGILVFLKENDIEEVYTTAVSDFSRSILPKLGGKLLATKEEERKVYLINLNNIPQKYIQLVNRLK